MLLRLCCLCACLRLIATAQDPPLAGSAKTLHVVQASGEATLTAKPDRALINVGVSTQAPTAAAASQQNAADTTHVLEAVKKILVSAGEVQTRNYSVTPQYDYTQDRHPRLIGYQTSNSVVVTIDDLSLVSKIIDAATGAGSNQVNGISFSLRDDSEIRSHALAAAASKAKANAEAIARALNLRVIGVIEAQTGSSATIRPLPFEGRMLMKAAAPQSTTPIESGSLEIEATVTVTLEVQ